MKYLNLLNQIFIFRKILPVQIQNYNKIYYISSGFFHSSTKYNATVHVGNENTYAFKVLQTVPRVTNLPNSDINLQTELEPEVLTKLTSSELVEKFIKCSLKHTPLSDSIFDPLVEELLRRSRKLSDDEIYSLLDALARFPEVESVNSRNFGELWSMLDDMCLEKLCDWNTDKILDYGELWYKLRLGKLSDFMQRGMDKIVRKPKKLSKDQMVKVLFYMNVIRKSYENMFDIGLQVGKLLEEFNIDELGVISMAFFKTQSKIRDTNILSYLMDAVVRNKKTIHEITLCSIMKIIRYSNHIMLMDKMRFLLDHLVSEIDRLSLLSCVHIALVGTNSQLFHEEIIQKICEKFMSNIKIARLKDIERLAFVTTLFNYDPVGFDFYRILVEELKLRDVEIQKYPRSLISLLHFLSLRNLYPTELISKTMTPEFLKHTYGKNLIGRELFHIDRSIKIDVPEYNGNQLPEKTRKTLAKFYTSYAPERGRRLNVTDKFMLEIMEYSEKLLGGSQFIKVEHILPQYERADIIYGISNENKPINVQNCYNETNLWDIKYPERDDVNWFAVVIGGWNCFIRDTDLLLGVQLMKIRHLRKIGYQPILVNWYDWNPLNNSAREEYLKNKLRV